MKALERYYQDYLLGYSQDANWSDYDIDVQYTKDRIESILTVGYLSDADIAFVRSLLPEIENDYLRKELEEYLERLMTL